MSFAGGATWVSAQNQTCAFFELSKRLIYQHPNTAIFTYLSLFAFDKAFPCTAIATKCLQQALFVYRLLCLCRRFFTFFVHGPKIIFASLHLTLDPHTVSGGFSVRGPEARLKRGAL